LASPPDALPRRTALYPAGGLHPAGAQGVGRDHVERRDTMTDLRDLLYCVFIVGVLAVVIAGFLS
jgi:hypothetical protein